MRGLNIRDGSTFFLLLLALIAGCDGGGDGKKPERPAATVEVREAATVSLDSALELVGGIRAVKQSVIASEVEGRVIALYREGGDPVSEGETILALDDTEYRLRQQEAEGAHTKAQAAAATAKLDLARTEKLHAEGVVSDEMKEQSALRLKTAEGEALLASAAYDRAKRAVNLCAAKAPFTGLIASLKVDLGEWVKEGDPLFETVDIDKVEVNIEAPERSIARITRGAPATVTIDAFPGDVFTGAITTLSPLANPTTRSFPATITLENADHRIKAGLVARVTLALDEARQVVMVPRDALVWTGQRSILFIVDADGAAREREVVVGRQKGALVEVSAVKPGEKVVVTGNEVLTDGAPVIVIKGPGA